MWKYAQKKKYVEKRVTEKIKPISYMGVKK